MSGERRLLRIGEYLVRRACQQLPPNAREERYREWAAELPAILHDPQIRPAPRRAARMLGYAADTLRGTAMTAARARTPRMTAWLCLLLAAGLVNVAWAIWAIVRAPGHGQNYLQLTWALLFLAIPISILAHSPTRVPKLIAVAVTLTGAAVNLWNAAQAPEDSAWVNYFGAALLLLSLVGAWLISRWSGPGRHKAARTQQR
jgi:hypothetical protein